MAIPRPAFSVRWIAVGPVSICGAVRGSVGELWVRREAKTHVADRESLLVLLQPHRNRTDSQRRDEILPNRSLSILPANRRLDRRPPFALDDARRRDGLIVVVARLVRRDVRRRKRRSALLLLLLVLFVEFGGGEDALGRSEFGESPVPVVRV